MTSERVMQIAREHFGSFMSDGYFDGYQDELLAFASRIREEAVRECAAAAKSWHEGTFRTPDGAYFGTPDAAVLSLIEKKP